MFGGWIVFGHLYHHWFEEGLTDPNSPNYDAIIAGKAIYLNAPAFLIREVVFLGAYSICAFLLAKYSYNEDIEGGMTYYKKSFKLAAIFLVVFGFTSPIWIFDTIMSLEAHWFSTMFGWYNFAAMYVCSIVYDYLDCYFLKEGRLYELGK